MGKESTAESSKVRENLGAATPSTPLGQRVFEAVQRGYTPLLNKLKPAEQKQAESLCHAVAAYTVAFAIGQDPSTLDPKGMKELGAAVHPKLRRAIFDCMNGVIGRAQNAALEACSE